MLRSSLVIAAAVVLAAGVHSQGIITTVAGTDITYPSGSFPADAASFGLLQFGPAGGVGVSPINGKVYFTSTSRSLIVAYDPAHSTVEIAAGVGIAGFSGDGGPAVNAAINVPEQIAFDPAGTLYFADRSGIRKIDSQGIITTVF